QNLENIGFSKKGFECIYNMQIIEERQTIVAFGADAVTKVVINSENRIERQHNIKDIKLYIENIEAMIRKKLDVLEQILSEE
ncbi:MAG TPA: coproporphyrinogen dehydrogenase HemZ, partial [Bacillota bacterium]|nr:coproporphyrinogen dehydrogenase HemZ [Bacillota bacterium]